MISASPSTRSYPSDVVSELRWKPAARGRAVLALLALVAAAAVAAAPGMPRPLGSRVEPVGTADAPLGDAARPKGAPPEGAAGANVGGEGATTQSVTPVRWVPTPGEPWQWQLTTPVNRSVDVPVYDIDGFENSATVVAALKGGGKRVICYVDVGGWESYRPDASRYPKSVLGRTIDGWPDERYVDIRRIDLLSPIIGARFDMCKAKGFDAIEPDVLDAYTARSGFPLSSTDQLRFNRWVATMAHDRGMSVALKGDVDQAASLVTDFDFAINEECFAYKECAMLEAFTDAGKAVLHVEYSGDPAFFCPKVKALGFSSMKKRVSLDAWRRAC